MGNSKNLPLADQLTALGIASTTAGAAIAAAAQDNGGQPTIVPLYDETAVLTAGLISQRIKGAMELLQLAFTDQEVRIKGSNGRLYRPGRPMPDGVHYEVDDTTGENVEVTVNRLEWRMMDALGAVVNKFERSLDNEETRIEQQKAQLAKTIRLEAAGRATQANIDFEANKLETMIEHAAVTLSAFRAAYEAHSELTGVEYETKAMRQERERIAAAKPSAVNGDDRIARLLGANIKAA